MDAETLKGFGLDDTQVKSVMAEYGKNINPLKQERDSIKEQLEDVTGKLTEAQKQAEQGSDLSEQLKTLQADFDKSKSEAEDNLKATKKSYEIQNALTAAGAKNAKAVTALLDVDKVNFDDNGGLIGLKEQLEKVKNDNDFLFAGNDDGAQNAPHIVAGGNPNPTGITGKKALSDYSYSELSALKSSNPTAYKTLVGGQE